MGIPELQLYFIQFLVWWMISFNLSITCNLNQWEFACTFHFRMKCWQLSLEKRLYDFEISEAFSIHSPNSCKWRFRAKICQQASFTWSLAVWKKQSVVTPRCLQNSDFCQVLYGFTPNTPLLNDTKSLVNVLLDGQRFPGRVPLAPKKKRGMFGSIKGWTCCSSLV